VPKVHIKPIKRPKKDSNIESKIQLKCPLVWRTGLSGVPPDSVRCTRDSNSELLTFGNSGSHSAIIHRTVRYSTGQCPVAHQTVRVPVEQRLLQRQRSPATALNALQCTQKSGTRHKAHRTVYRTCPMHHRTVRWPRRQKLQRSESNGWVTWHAHRIVSGGTPDSVRWRTGLSGAPCDSSLHQTASLVVGGINNPHHPPFIASKFSDFLHLTRAIAFNTRHTKEIKSSPKSKDHSNQIVTSERVTCVHLSSCAWIAFLLHSFL
jgi:hypothetical protein